MTPKPQTTDPDTLPAAFFAKVPAVKQSQPAYVQPAKPRRQWSTLEITFVTLSTVLLGAGAWNLALCIFGG